MAVGLGGVVVSPRRVRSTKILSKLERILYFKIYTNHHWIKKLS